MVCRLSRTPGAWCGRFGRRSGVDHDFSRGTGETFHGVGVRLDARSRLEAVARATRVGLLPRTTSVGDGAAPGRE